MSETPADPGARGVGLGPSAFAPSVAPHVQSVDTAEWERVYVVGDVHGCLDRLEALLDRLDLAADDLLVFVGDLVRKGPDSRAVLELVRDSPNMLSVRGNNEQKFLDGSKSNPEIDPLVGDIRELPAAIALDGDLVVHGGVDPRRPLAEHSVADLLTTRSVPPGNGYDGPFWFDRYEGPPRVFFGHTVLEEPVVTDWAVGLDTGCVYGGELTAYDYRADRLVAVPGTEHESRPDRKFLDLEY